MGSRFFQIASHCVVEDTGRLEDLGKSGNLLE